MSETPVDRSWIALLLLHAQTALCLFMAFGMGGVLFFHEVDPERGSPLAAKAVAVMAFAIFAGLGAATEWLARGIRARRDWALTYAYGLFMLWCPTIVGIPIAVAGARSLESIEHEFPSSSAA